MLPRSGSRSEFVFVSVFWCGEVDRKSTRLNSSHLVISYAVFCLKKKKIAPKDRKASFDASCPKSADRPLISCLHVPLDHDRATIYYLYISTKVESCCPNPLPPK